MSKAHFSKVTLSNNVNCEGSFRKLLKKLSNPENRICFLISLKSTTRHCCHCILIWFWHWPVPFWASVWDAPCPKFEAPVLKVSTDLESCNIPDPDYSWLWIKCILIKKKKSKKQKQKKKTTRIKHMWMKHIIFNNLIAVMFTALGLMR